MTATEFTSLARQLYGRHWQSEVARVLASTLEASLADVRVYKVGKTSADVYIVGKTPAGTLGGLKTQVVET